MPALIIKPRLILVMHTDDLGSYMASNQQEQMFVHILNRIVNKPNATPGQMLYCTTDCIPVDLMFQEKFATNTQVWNHLSCGGSQLLYLYTVPLHRSNDSLELRFLSLFSK